MGPRTIPQRLWPLLPFGRGESPTSLLSRLARLHGRNPPQICRDFALSYRGIVEGAAAALASLGRLGRELIRAFRTRRVVIQRCEEASR